MRSRNLEKQNKVIFIKQLTNMDAKQKLFKRKIMKTEKLGKDSAFPIIYDNPQCHGISKRLYISTMAMQGLLANTNPNTVCLG